MKLVKESLMDDIEMILYKHGMGHGDYILSLQGPTVIFTRDAKPSKELLKELYDNGILVIGPR